MDFSIRLCYTFFMKEIHRENSDVRRHYTVQKNSAESFHAKILYAGELKKSIGWKEQLHSHPFCEIVYVKSGSGTLYTDSDSFAIRQGDLLVYNPGTVHSEASDEDQAFSLLFCGIDRLHLKDKPINCILDANACPVLHTDRLQPLIESYFENLIAEMQSKSYYYDEVSRALVRIILNLVLRLLTEQDKTYFKTNESYQRARDYIDRNYSQIECVEDVCKNMYISRYYLTHLFKEYSGLSPIQYIISKRMEKAKELLETTDLPIHDIALRSGYNEISSFLKTFKKIENMTPSEYRDGLKKQ